PLSCKKLLSDLLLFALRQRRVVPMLAHLAVFHLDVMRKCVFKVLNVTAGAKTFLNGHRNREGLSCTKRRTIVIPPPVKDNDPIDLLLLQEAFHALIHVKRIANKVNAETRQFR